jgi:hypothetical protein
MWVIYIIFLALEAKRTAKFYSRWIIHQPISLSHYKNFSMFRNDPGEKGSDGYA